jgi:Uma2 family endonuclease
MVMVAPTLWTATMVREMPDDGNRYECVGGVLLVTPAPRPVHQLVVARLMARLIPYLAANAPTLLAHSSESEITWGEERTYLQPDVYVAPEAEFRDWTDVRSLALAVEVLSPSSIRHDRVTKRPVYQRHGVTYWVVDVEACAVEVWRPDDERPAIATEVLAWQLDDGAPELRIPLTELFAPPRA